MGMTKAVTGNNTVRDLICYSLLVATSVGFAAAHSAEASRVEIIIERVERVSRDEVHFQVGVTNRSERAVFLNGIDDEFGPRLNPVYLEQRRTNQGWKVVVPCLDTEPPHVIKLNPGEGITSELVLKVPLLGVCKERDIRLEGKFRFRVEYFETEKQARAYVKTLFSDRWREARAPVAVSETFEIPPVRNLE